MFLKKQTIADLLFGVQIVCAGVFGVSQFVRMLTTSQGVSITWFAFWLMFLVVNLVLAVRAHKAQPSRVTAQTIASYSAWTVVITADLILMVSKGNGEWDHRDYQTVLYAGLGIAVVLLIAWFKKLEYSDPIVRGWLAVFFKAVPQLMLAYKIYSVGGAGLSGVAVINGHITIMTRLGQLCFSIREAGWDRNRIGSAMSEMANETSWMVATIVWFTI